MRRITILLIVTLVTASGLVFAQPAGKDDLALKDLVKQLIDAQIRYDVATLDKLFTADYIEISPVGEFDTRDKVLSFYAPQKKSDPAKMSMKLETSEYSIRSDGQVAIVIARLNMAITAAGKAMPPASMRVTFVLRKEGSAWKFASAHYTGIRPSKPRGQ
ncbi:MAG: nuclear transport factor 2 family protein [Vicinamibacterales bacterium]